MKLALPIFFVLTFFGQPFISNAQKKCTFEFEVAPVLSNRVLRLVPNSSNSHLNNFKAQSKFLPGFHFQLGVNFFENKRTRVFIGLRGLMQRTQVSHFHPYAIHIDPNGNVIVSGTYSSKKTNMTYLLFPVSIKQNLISKPDFRMVGEIGIASGFLVSDIPEYSGLSNRVAVFSDLALSFEWKLINGNTFGMKFPMFSYSLLPNCIISNSINQYNYSLGLGVQLGLGKSEPTTYR
jgi:hypothetical protein